VSDCKIVAKALCDHLKARFVFTHTGAWDNQWKCSNKDGWWRVDSNVNFDYRMDSNYDVNVGLVIHDGYVKDDDYPLGSAEAIIVALADPNCFDKVTEHVRGSFIQSFTEELRFYDVVVKSIVDCKKRFEGEVISEQGV